MKKLTFVAILYSAFNVTAFSQSKEVVISERVVDLNININTTALKLSAADYSSPVVKVLVPDLAAVTILDHRNSGEDAPCLATYKTNNPDDVIQNNPSTEKEKFIITLKKYLTPSGHENLCYVKMEESIVGHIRGFKFEHSKFWNVETRHIDDCK